MLYPSSFTSLRLAAGAVTLLVVMGLRSGSVDVRHHGSWRSAITLIVYAIFFSFFNDVVFGILFASVAGIMVFISLDELLPTAQEYGEHHLVIYGLIAGMAVMAMSLLLFA